MGECPLTAKPVIGEDDDEYLVIEGDRLELPCQAVGRPSPTVTWTKANRPLLPNSPLYTVQVSDLIVSFVYDLKSLRIMKVVIFVMGQV